MPKIVTRQSRIAETRQGAHELRTALAAAWASESDPDATDAARLDLWADVANAAGQVQRRSRQLAGLGRGG